MLINHIFRNWSTIVDIYAAHFSKSKITVATGIAKLRLLTSRRFSLIFMNEETAYEQQCYYLYQVGADVSGHFGTDGAEVSGHFGTSADVLRTVRHWCRSVLGPKCLYTSKTLSVQRSL